MPHPERQLIQRVRSLARQASRGPNAVVTGIGDDCAVLRPPSGHELLVTTDFSLEGVHFRRDWHPPESVGHRCLTRGLSDIAAMGGQPLACFLSLALPADLPQSWVDAFYRGLLKLATEHKVALAGGDTAQSPGQSPNAVLADIMVMGSVPRGKAVLRSGAKPGDRLYVTGSFGESSAEIRRRYAAENAAQSSAPAGTPKVGVNKVGLSKGSKTVGAEDFATKDFGARAFGWSRPSGLQKTSLQKRGALAPEGRFLFPQPRLAAGQKLRSLASAMIDISDGLSTDLSHLCDESHLGALLYQSAIPIAHSATLDDALYGGDDYELLFTSDKRVPKTIADVPITEIGEVVDRKGMWIQDERGKTRRLKAKGWEHFATRDI